MGISGWVCCGVWVGLWGGESPLLGFSDSGALVFATGVDVRSGSKFGIGVAAAAGTKVSAGLGVAVGEDMAS